VRADTAVRAAHVLQACMRLWCGRALLECRPVKNTHMWGRAESVASIARPLQGPEHRLPAESCLPPAWQVFAACGRQGRHRPGPHMPATCPSPRPGAAASVWSACLQCASLHPSATRDPPPIACRPWHNDLVRWGRWQASGRHGDVIGYCLLVEAAPTTAPTAPHTCGGFGKGSARATGALGQAWQ